MNKHDEYLEKLVFRLSDIDESTKDIAWIIRDGVWMKENESSRMKMPDLIMFYYSGLYSLVELKGAIDKYEKAKVQLESGESFVKKFFNAEKIRKKFVVYSKKKYLYQTVY